VKYGEYTFLKDRLDWLLLSHPEYVEFLTDRERRALSVGFLFETSDEDYPGSLSEYFERIVASDDELISEMCSAGKRLYRLSGMGDLRNDLPGLDGTLGG
jgi:hypothetical protein